MEKQTIKRNIAYKCCASWILDSEFVKEEGWTPNYLVMGNRNVSRVNIIAAVVGKEENEHNIRLSIDDGSGVINLLAFENIPCIVDIKIGDIVNVVGKPRVFNEDKYIMPETIKCVDKEWLRVRQKELERSKGPEKKIETPKDISETKDDKIHKKPIVETISDDTSDKPLENPTHTDIILDTIRLLDKSGGIGFEEISEKIDFKDTETILNDLLKKGEIFEIKPGRYKVLS